MAADSKSNSITLSLEQATLIRLVLKHAYMSQSSGYNIDPSAKQSNVILVSKAERNMLDKLLGTKLETIDKNKVFSQTLNKCAHALIESMGGSVEYKDDGYEEEPLCHAYFMSLSNVKK
jgi:ribosomal protein L15